MSTPFDIAADPEGNPQPAPEEPEPEPQVVEEQPPPPPRKKRGRPPRRIIHAPPPDAPPPMEAREKRMAAPPDGLPKSVAIPPDTFDEHPNEIVRDPGGMWTILTRQWVDSLRNISELQVVIDRVKVDGRVINPVIRVQVLSGDQIAGDERTTPGEQLVEHVELVCHRDMGSASYKVSVRNKHTGKTVRTSEELALEPYNKIVQRRTQMEDAQRRKLYGDPAGGYASPSYVAGAARPGMVGGPVPTPSGMDPLTKHLLDTVLGQLNDARTELAALRGQPAPPPVTMPAVGAATVDPQDQFLRQLETQRRIAALLQPAQPAVNIEQAVMQAIVKLQEAGVIPKAGAPVAAAPPVDSFQAWIEARKRDQDFEKIFRQRFPDYVHKDEVEARKNVYDPEAGPAPSKEFPLSTYMGEALRWVPWVGSEGSPDSWGEWVMRMAAENPRRSGDFFGGILKVAASVLPMDKLSGLLEAMTKKGGQAAEAAAAHAANNGTQAAGGWSPAT